MIVEGYDKLNIILGTMAYKVSGFNSQERSDVKRILARHKAYAKNGDTPLMTDYEADLIERQDDAFKFYEKDLPLTEKEKTQLKEKISKVMTHSNVTVKSPWAALWMTLSFITVVRILPIITILFDKIFTRADDKPERLITDQEKIKKAA